MTLEPGDCTDGVTVQYGEDEKDQGSIGVRNASMFLSNSHVMIVKLHSCGRLYTAARTAANVGFKAHAEFEGMSRIVFVISALLFM